MKLQLSDLKPLIEVVKVLKQQSNEANIEITKDEIKLFSPSQTMVSLAEARLLSTMFDEYKIETDLKASINLELLFKILKKANAKQDVLTIESDENNLYVTIINGYTNKCTLPLMEFDKLKEEGNQINKLDSHKALVEFETGIFKKMINSIDDDMVAIEINENKMTLTSGESHNKSIIELCKGDSGLISLRGESKSNYSVELLKTTIADFKFLTLESSNDYPLLITYKDIDKVIIKIVIAPRVSED